MALPKLSRILLVGAMVLGGLSVPVTASAAAQAAPAGTSGPSGPLSLLEGAPDRAEPVAAELGTRTGPAAALVGDRPSRPRVAPEVTQAAAKGGSVPVIIRLRDQVDLDTVAADARRAAATAGAATADAAKAARGRAVVDALRTKADHTQQRVRQLLGQVRAAGVRSYWIFNGFTATVPAAAVDRIAAHPDVASIELDAEHSLPEPEPGEPRLPTWALEKVKAPQVWGDYGFTGDGVVVGIMDSGVDGGHPALADSYRGRNGDHKESWFAATGENYPTPGDGHGHGTHVTGTVLGASPGDITGVAPDAEWIAAKIFRDSGSTSNSIIHAAFEWMIAPGGNPANAPDVVNNSWGASATYHTEFWEDVNAWVAAGIFPSFAAGNDGPGPVGSPGSFPQSFAVGATDINDQIASFSSRGPATWDGVEYTKPQVSAPGVDIHSTWPRQLIPSGYRTISGTSMATPHLTGVVALLLDAQPDLSVDALRELLTSTARVEPHMGTVPNNEYGSGIVDAHAAVVAARFSGTVSGTVTGPQGPVAATLTVPELGVSTRSDATGHYELRLKAGTWPVTIRSYGHVTRTIQVTVAQSEQKNLDIALQQAAVHQVVGTVSGPDGPIADATVRVTGTPLAPLYTDANGRYSADVAAGTYQLSAEITGYQRRTVELVLDADRTVDLRLSPLDIDTVGQWREYQNNPRRSGQAAGQLAAEALTQRWQVKLSGQAMFSSPVIADGRVYLATNSGRLYAMSLTDGSTLWSYATGANLRGTPAIADGRLYFGGGDDGVFRALDARTGELIWSHPTGDRLTYTTPTVIGDTVYFGTGWGEGDGGWVYALDATTGALRWRTFIGAQVFFAPAMAAGTVFAGSYESRRLVALDAATGAEKWALTRDDDGFAAIPTYADGTVYVGTNNFDTGIGSILAVDAATGKPRWEAAGHGDASGSAPIVHGDLVIAGSNQNQWVAAYDRATGQRRWISPAGSAVSNALLAADGVVLGGSQLDHRAWALDAYTGELRWETTLADNVLSAPAYADGKLVIAVRNGQVTMFEAPGTVTGTVRDPAGGVLGGTVRDPATGASASIDPATGRYTLTHQPGTFQLEILSYGHQPYTREVTVRSGRTVTVDATLAPSGVGSLTGVVTGDDGQPLAGVTVSLPDAPLEPQRTDGSGRYTFGEVAEGTHRITATRDGRIPYAGTVRVAAGERAEHDLTLDRYQIAVTGDYRDKVAGLLRQSGYAVQSTTLSAIATHPGDYQVVVVNGHQDDPGAELFNQFIAGADAAGTSVVVLGSSGGLYNPLGQLSRYTGNPATVGGGSSDGEVSVIARAGHPLTAGLTAGARTPIMEHEGRYGWFTGYTGQSVADLYVGDLEVAGSALGYQPRSHGSVHVLLGSFAVSALSAPDDGWLSAARQIFTNAVGYARSASFGTVTGRVTDAAGGAPLAATVSAPATGSRVTADADGTWSLLLPPGEHTLRIERAGYTVRELPVTVTADQRVTVDVALTGSGLGAVSGTVTSDGQPVAGARVELVGTGLAATSGADGGFTLSEVPGGRYQLRAGADGYVTGTVDAVTVVDATVTRVDVTLRRSLRVAVIGDSADVVPNEITTFLKANEVRATATGWTALDQLDSYDVVVLNTPTDPGEQAFTAALAKLDAAGVSAVFIEGPASSDGSVRLLRKYLGNPTGRDYELSSGDPLMHPVDPGHPIFAGLPDPTQVLLGDKWVGYYTGWTGIKLADFGTTEAGIVGVGVGYEPRTPTSVRLLLSGLAADVLASPSDGWTSDGKRLFLNALRWAAAPGLGAVRARVSGPAGEPVPGLTATVEETGVSVTGDDAGAFTLSHPAGEYTLRLQAFGYITTTQRITITSGHVDPAELTLALGEVGTIRGVVTDRASGAPLAGATVRLEGHPRQAVTGADGRYVLVNVEPGRHMVRVEADGHVRRLATGVTVTAGEETTRDMPLWPTRKVGVIGDYQGLTKAYLAEWGYQAEDLAWTDTARVDGYDLIVANEAEFSSDPGAAAFGAFTEAANRADVPIVWLGQYSRGAIRWLTKYQGDPTGQVNGRSDGTVTARVSADHPLAAGFPPGAEIPLTLPGKEYTAFTGYSGTTVASLVTGEQGERGAAIAYRGRTDASVDVLLSTLSISYYGYPPVGGKPGLNWTPQAELLLHSALDWALAAPPLAAEARGTVRGTAGQTPIASTITLVETGRTYTSRADDGSFLVPLQPGTWTLRVSTFGHETATRTVTVAAGESPALDIVLVPQPGGQLRGTVTGPGGTPLAGARLTLEGTPLTATSGADGGYLFTNVPAGEYVLRATLTGYGLPRLPVTVPAGETTVLDVPLVASKVVAVAGDSAGSVGAFLTGNGYQVRSWSWSDIQKHIGELDEVDLVVLNGSGSSPTAEEFNPFLAAAAEQGVSVIMAGQWGSGSIRTARSHRGDPQTIDDGFTDDGVGITYRPAGAHPIFAGFPVGEPIVLMRNPQGNAQQWQWYDGYSGRTVAAIGEEGGDDLGGGVGYRFTSPDSVEVLLEGLAASSYGKPGERWTPAAERIYLNAVEWAINATQAQVSGTVTADGAVLAGAEVHVVEAGVKVTTGEDGAFRLGLPGGTYTIRVTAYGFAPFQTTLTVDDDDVVELPVALVPVPRGTLTGTVTDTTGAPLVDAKVTADGTLDTSVATGADGGFRIGDLVPGDYTVRVSAPHHTEFAVAVTVTAGQDTAVPVVLRRNDVAVLGDERGALTGFLVRNGVAAEELDWSATGDVSAYRVVVVNGGEPDQQTFDTLVAAADGSRTSLLFTGTWGVEQGGIRLLERYGDGAVTVGAQGYRTGSVGLTGFDATHPLFAGISEPDTLLAPDSYWSGISGYVGPYLADLAVPGHSGTAGTAVAYDFRTASSMHLLISIGAVTGLIGPGHGWTPQMERLMLNAVAWAGDAEQAVPGVPTLATPATLTAADRIRLTGTAEFRSTVTVTRDGAVVGTATPGRDGRFSVEVPLVEGANVLVASAANHAGATPAAAPVTVTRDSRGPVLQWAPADRAGFFGTPAPVPVTGTATDFPAGVASVEVNGVPVPVGVDGTFRTTLELAVGEHPVTVVATDKLGNRSTESRTVRVFPYRDEWRFIGQRGSGALNVQLDLVDPAGAMVWADAVTLVLRDGQGAEVVRQPMHLEDGGWYRGTVLNLPAGGYTATAEVALDGWLVTLTGGEISRR